LKNLVPFWYQKLVYTRFFALTLGARSCTFLVPGTCKNNCTVWLVGFNGPEIYWTFIELTILFCFVPNRRSGRFLGHEYGSGEGEIWMDNLGCLGTETDLGECQHNGFAQHNCGHEEDVSISCNIGM